MAKLSKSKSVIFSILLLYTVVVPLKSDYIVYEMYYNGVTLSNFYQFSLDKGYMLTTAIFSSLGIPFIVFWKGMNLIGIITVFTFLVGRRSNYLGVAGLLCCIFILVYPYSANLFSNIIRNTMAVALFFYLYRIGAKWYFYFVPLTFHISTILLIFSLLCTKINMAHNYKKILFLFSLIMPCLAFLLDDYLVELLLKFDNMRTIRHNLMSEYKPAFRYLSFVLYLQSFIIFLYIQKANKLKGNGILLFYNLSRTDLVLLFHYFNVSLLLYWSFLGMGATSRILTYPMWFSMALWFSLIGVSVYSIAKNRRISFASEH